MKVQTVFVDGNCEIHIIPEDNWEKRLLGASFSENDQLDVEVSRSSHVSWQECDYVVLRRTK